MAALAAAGDFMDPLSAMASGPNCWVRGRWKELFGNGLVEVRDELIDSDAVPQFKLRVIRPKGKSISCKDR